MRFFFFCVCVRETLYIKVIHKEERVQLKWKYEKETLHTRSFNLGLVNLTFLVNKEGKILVITIT